MPEAYTLERENISGATANDQRSTINHQQLTPPGLGVLSEAGARFNSFDPDSDFDSDWMMSPSARYDSDLESAIKISH